MGKVNNKDFQDMKRQLNNFVEKAAFQKDMDRLERMINDLRNKFNPLNDKDYDLQKQIDNLNSVIEMMSKQMNSLKNQQPVQGMPSGPGIDEATLQDIFNRLGALENELDNFKNEFGRWVKDFQDSLNNKADMDTVKALEQSLLDRLNELVKALSKQFADKNDTRKALKLLEKNLKNMYDLFMSKGGNDQEDDAMFTKKPWGPTSCASCSKDVVDLYGKRVDFMPWGKLPFRDPSERIARVGQGFSKMLSMINPDHLSQYNGGFNHGSQDGLHQGQYENAHIINDGQGNKTVQRGGMQANQRTITNFNP